MLHLHACCMLLPNQVPIKHFLWTNLSPTASRLTKNLKHYFWQQAVNWLEWWGIISANKHWLPKHAVANKFGFLALGAGAPLEQASQPSVQDLEQNWEDVRSCKNGERTGLQQSHCLAPFAGCKKHCRPPIGAQNAALACLLHAASKPGPIKPFLWTNLSPTANRLTKNLKHYFWQQAVNWLEWWGIISANKHWLPKHAVANKFGFLALGAGAPLEQASQPSVQDLEQNWEDVRSCKNGERTGLQQSHCLAPFAGCKKHCRPPIGAQNAAIACLLHAASKPGPNQTLFANKLMKMFWQQALVAQIRWDRHVRILCCRSSGFWRAVFPTIDVALRSTPGTRGELQGHWVNMLAGWSTRRYPCRACCS